jgi:hypothetical protein
VTDRGPRQDPAQVALREAAERGDDDRQRAEPDQQRLQFGVRGREAAEREHGGELGGRHREARERHRCLAVGAERAELQRHQREFEGDAEAHQHEPREVQIVQLLRSSAAAPSSNEPVA